LTLTNVLYVCSAITSPHNPKLVGWIEFLSSSSPINGERDEMRQDWRKDFEATVLWAVWGSRRRKESKWLKYQRGKS